MSIEKLPNKHISEDFLKNRKIIREAENELLWGGDFDDKQEKEFENKDKLKNLAIMPNPALKGGELQVTAMEGAKQALYAEHRRKLRKGWQESLLACGCPACLGIVRDPAKEKGL